MGVSVVAVCSRHRAHLLSDVEAILLNIGVFYGLNFSFMKHQVLFFGFLLFFLVFFSVDMSAQCAMCKGAAETNLRQGGGDPQGLNNGILFMLSMPYLLVGGIGYWWWRNRHKEQEQVVDFSEDDFARYN